MWRRIELRTILCKKFHTISRIDFSPVLACKTLAYPSPDVLQTIKEIGDACSGIGFLYLMNTGEVQRLGHKAFREAKRFFEQPISCKQKLLTNNGQRGYYQYVSAAGLQDSIEAFNMGNPDCSATTLRAPYFRQVYGPRNDHVWKGLLSSDDNRWQHPPDGFQTTLEEYYRECDNTCKLVLQCLSIYLGLPYDFFHSLHSRRDHSLELKFYPARQFSATQNIAIVERLPVHTDLSSVTCLQQDTQAGH